MQLGWAEWVLFTHCACCHPHCASSLLEINNEINNGLLVNYILDLCLCSLMLDDLGEAIRGATHAFCSTSQTYLAGGSSGHRSHRHSFSNLVSDTPRCLLGIVKDTLTFSKLTEGGDRKNTWVRADPGSSGSPVIWCVCWGGFWVSQPPPLWKRGRGAPLTGVWRVNNVSRQRAPGGMPCSGKH